MVDCCCIIFLLLKLILSLFTLFLVAVFCVRLWLQPFKGVCKCEVKLHGKVALVTGGNSGIGLETARGLAQRGAQVFIAARNVRKSEEAVADIIATTNNRNVQSMHLDLSKFSSIKKFADHFNKSAERLDILVNNAGCAGLKQAYTEDGIEKIMQINYVGPFLLTHLLKKKMEASKPSRIVIVSSKGHTSHVLDPEDLIGKRSLDFWGRYANSKVCNILWAKGLAKRLPEGITANALDPGIVVTNIFHRYSKLYKTLLLFVIGAFFKTAEEGAQTSLHLCLAPELEGVSGEYFKDCKIHEPHKITKDENIVNIIWDKTMLLIKDALQ